MTWDEPAAQWPSGQPNQNGDALDIRVLTAVVGTLEGAVAQALTRSDTAHLARRCADAAELLGAAQAGLGAVAVVSSDLAGFDRNLIAALRSEAVEIVALNDPLDQFSTQRLHALGVRYSIAQDADGSELEEIIVRAARTGTSRSGSAGTARPLAVSDGSTLVETSEIAGLADALSSFEQLAHSLPDDTDELGEKTISRSELAGLRASALDPQADAAAASGTASVGSTPSDELAAFAHDADSTSAFASVTTPTGFAPDAGDALGNVATPGSGGTPGVGAMPGIPEVEATEPSRGKLVTVWGSHGAPGRSTIAAALAFALAQQQRTMLVDADTYAPSLTQALGLLEESSGLAFACRSAGQGTLNETTLQRAEARISDQLSILTGLPRIARWPELSKTALEAVYIQAREGFSWIIADTAPPIEEDELLSFDTRAPQRNGATITSLEEADLHIVVGRADPIGIKRLVMDLESLREDPRTARTPRIVVINQLDARRGATDRKAQIKKVMAKYCPEHEPFFIPFDSSEAMRALDFGRAVTEGKRKGEIGTNIVALAELVQAGFLTGQAPAPTEGAKSQASPVGV